MLKRLLPWRRGPIRINVEFEERPYRLGDSIRLTVELKLKKEVLIDEGRVDLVFEETFADTVTKMEQVHYQPGFLTPRKETLIDSHGKRETREKKNSLVCGSVVFVKDVPLSRDAPGIFNATLQIQPDRPPYGIASTTAWALVTTVRLADGLEEAYSQAVDVASA